MYKIIGADGQQYGPVTAEQVRQWIVEGRASAQTQVRLEGSVEWKPLGQIEEFAAQFSAAAPPQLPLVSQSRPYVPNYLAPSILCTIFCCLPFGIPAIVFAAQVNTKLQAGDLAGATESSRKAKRWCWMAFAFGLVPMLAWVAGIALGLMKTSYHMP